MSKTDILLCVVAGLGVLVTLFSMVCLFIATRKRRNLPNHTPPVTIYKPLKGIDDGLELNLRSFFELDYPTFQLIFGVADERDPVIELVRRLIEEYPASDAMLVVGNPAFGLNPKVENLAAMQPHRKHEIILISDSNVRVRPSYLRETACYLADPAVGLVTNLFAGTQEREFGAILENLQLNGFVAGGVATAGLIGATCVVGKSMLLPVRVLNEVGGLVGVRNLLAEDQVLGLRVRKAGYKIRLSHHVIENVNSDRDLRWFLNRHSRWFKMRFHLATVAFLLEPGVNFGTLGILWALSGDSGFAWGGLALLGGLGMLRDAVQTKRLRGSFPRWRHLPLSFVKDLFLFPLWCDALVNRRINWRGHRLTVGRLTRLRRARTPRDVRRRVRRLRRLRDQHSQDNH